MPVNGKLKCIIDTNLLTREERRLDLITRLCNFMKSNSIEESISHFTTKVSFKKLYEVAIHFRFTSEESAKLLLGDDKIALETIKCKSQEKTIPCNFNAPLMINQLKIMIPRTKQEESSLWLARSDMADLFRNSIGPNCWFNIRNKNNIVIHNLFELHPSKMSNVIKKLKMDSLRVMLLQELKNMITTVKTKCININNVKLGSNEDFDAFQTFCNAINTYESSIQQVKEEDVSNKSKIQFYHFCQSHTDEFGNISKSKVQYSIPIPHSQTLIVPKGQENNVRYLLETMKTWRIKYKHKFIRIL